MSKVDHIIAETFRLTGVRLTADDPVVAVLLMQEQALKSAFASFDKQQEEKRKEFMLELAEHEANITQAAAKLEAYREQLLADLLQQANRQMEDAEPKLYAAVHKRIAADVNQVNGRLVDRLNRLIMTALLIAGGIWVAGIFILWWLQKPV